MLPTARHRYSISSKGAVLPGRNERGDGARQLVTRFANSKHTQMRVTISPKIFKLKENKTKMRNIHLRIFHLLFEELTLGFELGFGL